MLYFILLWHMRPGIWSTIYRDITSWLFLLQLFYKVRCLIMIISRTIIIVIEIIMMKRLQSIISVVGAGFPTIRHTMQSHAFFWLSSLVSPSPTASPRLSWWRLVSSLVRTSSPSKYKITWALNNGDTDAQSTTRISRGLMRRCLAEVFRFVRTQGGQWDLRRPLKVRVTRTAGGRHELAPFVKPVRLLLGE